MVKARLIEAFEVARRYPDLGPGRFEPADIDNRDTRLAIIDLTAQLDPDEEESPLAAELFETRENAGATPEFGSGFRVYRRGVTRAEAARRRNDLEELDAILRSTRRKVRDDPTAWRDLCKTAEAKIMRSWRKRFEQVRMYEALGWIVTKESHPESNTARKTTLSWLSSALSVADYCRVKGELQLDLRRAVRHYCETVARRLGTSPPESRPALDPRPNLIWGLENIAGELLRTPQATLRMIEAGRIPAAEFFGELCADRRMLGPFREMHRDRQSTAALSAAA